MDCEAEGPLVALPPCIDKMQCPDKELRSQGYRPESPAFLAV